MRRPRVPAPLWRDEFAGSSLSLATDGGGGTWRTRGYEAGGSVQQGYRDFAGSSWNVSPVQHPDHSPFAVADSVLTVTARRNPGLTDVDGADWLSGYLVSNHLTGLTWRGGYFEWRAAFPDSGRGMFPALWLFNNVPGRSDGKQGAEIDVLEVLGESAGTPYEAGYHRRPVPGLGTTVGRWDLDTRGWHRYGLEWTPDRLVWWRDGVALSEVTGSDAAWFGTADLGLRMDYVMDPAFAPEGSPLRSTAVDPPVGTELRMLVDYVRVWRTRPTGMSTGSADPLLR